MLKIVAKRFSQAWLNSRTLHPRIALNTIVTFTSEKQEKKCGATFFYRKAPCQWSRSKLKCTLANRTKLIHLMWWKWKAKNRKSETREKIKENLIGITEQNTKKNVLISFFLPLSCKLHGLPPSRILLRGFICFGAMYCCCAVANCQVCYYTFSNDSFCEKWSDGETTQRRTTDGGSNGAHTKNGNQWNDLQDEGWNVNEKPCNLSLPLCLLPSLPPTLHKRCSCSQQFRRR